MHNYIIVHWHFGLQEKSQKMPKSVSKSIEHDFSHVYFLCMCDCISRNPSKLMLERSCLNMILSNFVHRTHWASLDFDYMSLKKNGQDFTICRVINVTHHGGPSIYVLEMIKHNTIIFHITNRLHLLTKG